MTTIANTILIPAENETISSWEILKVDGAIYNWRDTIKQYL